VPGLGPVGLVALKATTALFLFPHLLFIPRDTIRTYVGGLRQRFEDRIENSFPILFQDTTLDFSLNHNDKR